MVCFRTFRKSLDFLLIKISLFELKLFHFSRSLSKTWKKFTEKRFQVKEIFTWDVMNFEMGSLILKII